jgi:hypothetical protein
VARVWLTFSLVAFAVAVVFALWDGDHPLHSDDPYVVGSLIGGVSAGASFLFAVPAYLGRSPGRKPLAYFGPLAAVALLPVAGELVAGGSEAGGLGIIIGGSIALFGLPAFFIQWIKLTWLCIALLSLPGVFFLVGYAMVAVRMSRAWG